MLRVRQRSALGAPVKVWGNSSAERKAALHLAKFRQKPSPRTKLLSRDSEK